MKKKGSNKMKKRILALAVIAVLIMSMLVGCANTAPLSEQKDEKINAAARQTYMDFLGGKVKAKTAESFRADDEEYNYDGLLFGEYSLDEMKSAVEAVEMTESKVKYAFLDFGNDGVEELVLRFESINPDFLTWTGVLRSEGDGLYINYYYEEGYRSYASLYSTGWLYSGGSMGAGASTYSITRFDGKGVGSKQFSVSDYNGFFAEEIGYDLSADWFNRVGGWSGNYNSDEFNVREYVDENGVKLAVIAWSEDASMRAEEEALIDELAALGASVVSLEDMDAISDTSPYEGEAVAWLEL